MPKRSRPHSNPQTDALGAVLGLLPVNYITGQSTLEVDGVPVGSGGGGGTGTVTSVTATTPIVVTPSPLVAAGVISITDTTVTPGSYTLTNLTVDQKGRITAASNGTPGGVGTVTNFSAGDLSPIFTTTEANTTTTPALSFVLTNAAAHNYLGNNTGGSAAPDYHVIAYSELSGTPTIPADLSALHFVTTQAEGSLSSEFSLGTLTTGLLKHTVAAGVSTPATATAETDYVTPSGTGTLSNKRINPRVDSTTSASATTWAPNSDTTDIFELAGVLTVAVTTISNPSGTPVDGGKLIIRVKSDGSAHALTWSGSQWRASTDLALPTTTVASKTVYLGFIFNSVDTKWDLIAKLENI